MVSMIVVIILMKLNVNILKWPEQVITSAVHVMNFSAPQTAVLVYRQL